MKTPLPLGTAVALALAGGASAADLPRSAPAPIYTKAPPPAWNWTGCYVGANIGGGWNRVSASDPITGADLGTANGSGVVGGGQVGCDYQFSGAWVVGVGGQFEAANIRGTSGATPFAGGTFMDSKNPWLNTLTARFGYVVEPATLLYVRGGGAWSRDSLSTFASGAPPVLLATATDNRSGWTVGGGIEHIFLPNVSGFVEYNFIGLGTSTVVGSVPFTGAPFTVGSIRENIQEVLVGLNFRFGGLGGPPGARY